MRRIDTLRRAEQRLHPAAPSMSLEEYFLYAGRLYGLTGSSGVTPEATFVSYIHQVAERNGVVSAAVAARSLLISQTRFAWKNTRAAASPGRMWGNRDLSIIERPGTMSRPALLALMEKDVSYAGSAYVWRNGNTLHRLRPDGVHVVLGSESEPVGDWVPADAKVIGYTYRDPSKGKSGRVQAFEPNEIVAWSPEPHPLEWWRGESWVTSVISEIRNDGQATDHTSKFFENAATPNMVFTLDPSLTPKQVEEHADAVTAQHAGVNNAYKSVFVGGGASAMVVGSENAALGLKDIQGGYETRIATRGRVPAVVLGIREGLAGSALNSGNYSVARRLWADGWYTPDTQLLAASFESILPVPADAELAPDPADVLFLQEDRKDAAEIQKEKSTAIRQLVDAGYDPLSVVDAIETDDFAKLSHSGLFSVQLQPPTTGTPADPAA